MSNGGKQIFLGIAFLVNGTGFAQNTIRADRSIGLANKFADGRYVWNADAAIFEEIFYSSFFLSGGDSLMPCHSKRIRNDMALVHCAGPSVRLINAQLYGTI